MRTEFSHPQPETAGPRNDYGRIRVDHGDRRRAADPLPYLDRFAATMEAVFLTSFRAADRKEGRL